MCLVREEPLIDLLMKELVTHFSAFTVILN